MFNTAAWSRHANGGGGIMGLVRKLVVLAFAVIQLVLVARILLDLGVIPADFAWTGAIVTWSDALAAPVQGVGSGLGEIFGGGGIPGMGPGLGDGLNPAMVAALVGWTVVEGLVLRVVAKFVAA
jgi:hypothetical protein